MKKVLSVVLVFGLVCGVFTGCGDSESWTTFEGEYFKIDYPKGLIANDDFNKPDIFEKKGENGAYVFDIETAEGSIQMGIIFDSGDVVPMIDNTETLSDKADYLRDIIREELSQFEDPPTMDVFTDFILSKRSAFRIEGPKGVTEFDKSDIYFIPLDGWHVMMWTYFNENNKEIVDKMLESFEITDYQYGTR
ncbi:MAG TPA: hypothetical protein PKV16_07210 [Caldisericia bacterium]|nr:hypothetical protein [Caldisericia bacterium]HPF49557.1 hypothetical protein [Caldisericia bacterium]HPI84149.1 hypothetical protein [Caldisericia bacterium]HPQ93556.1 hypothetical protein [Caldisericia bacterium]HRV75438.1 hypothetical protein [Caldisericia bacterium]